MMTRTLSVVVLALCLIAWLAWPGTAQQRQSPSSVTSPGPMPGTGRYQYFEGVVPKVFDTQTGRVYMWFPRNEKEQKEPELFVQDPVAGTGTTIAIKFINQPAR